MKACAAAGAGAARCEIDLGTGRSVSIVELSEDISKGQSVSSYRLEFGGGAVSGTTIGYRRLHRFPTTRVQTMTLTVQSVAPTAPRVRVRVFAA